MSRPLFSELYMNSNDETITVSSKVSIMSPVDGKNVIRCEIIWVNNTDNTYYIHYNQLNKRYDAWVKYSDFIIDSKNVIELPKKKKKSYEKKISDKVEEETRIRNFNSIVIGNHCINTWYFSPYPKDVVKNKIVYICEFCLFYFNSENLLFQHAKKCDLRHPPGLQIYYDTERNLSFFEVDGYKQNNYCRNLALLSKLFLDHKSLIYDVDAFLFYVLCRKNDLGYYNMVGYFSKEKFSEQGYNLACILCLPSEQKKGYGKIIIDFSYLLSKKDNLISGPENPLSDLGLLSYRSYWLEVILENIRDGQNTINVRDISTRTNIAEDDIVGTLLANKMIKYHGDNLIIVLNDALVQKMKKNRVHKVSSSYFCNNY